MAQLCTQVQGLIDRVRELWASVFSLEQSTVCRSYLGFLLRPGGKEEKVCACVRARVHIQFFLIMLFFSATRERVFSLYTFSFCPLMLAFQDNLLEKNIQSIRDPLVTSNYIFLFYVIVSAFLKTILYSEKKIHMIAIPFSQLPEAYQQVKIIFKSLVKGDKNVALCVCIINPLQIVILR